MKQTSFFAILLASLLLCGCNTDSDAPVDTSGDLSIEYEKISLENGMDVVFHQDHSDPVVAVALTFHVGSAREKPGRTGFAHLFEHLFFLESENLGKGGLDKMSSRIGGSGANGSTSRDRTNYFQTVPRDALEKMIWAESDKVGFFINTVTEQVLTKEKQVVKNEKRQSYDNRPYGHTNYVISKNLYPEDHPYNWQVIGTLEDLQESSLEDVKEFHSRYYGPNNATLVIAGDFDLAQAKEWVHKYFDDIPAGEPVPDQAPMPVQLKHTKKLYYEDNFARLPALQLVWPGVEMYHPDSYALDILTQLLADGKRSPFYQVLVEEDQVTSRVDMYSRPSELAGEVGLSVRAFPDTDLDSVYDAIEMAFERFEANGFTEADLDRVKAGIETSYYRGLSSVLGKAFQLAQYNIFADDPGFINQQIQYTLEVNKEDVFRVYQKYIQDKPFIATSFVPEGQAVLALEGSDEADVIVEEYVSNGEGESFELTDEVAYERTPSTFDRTAEPPYGKEPEVNVPDVWQETLESGLDVYGIQTNELPLVDFNIRIRGGMLLEEKGKRGTSALLAEMLMKGTSGKTAAELEEAIDALGASINLSSGATSLTLYGSTLARNYHETMELVQEILLRPRWDSAEFVLAKQEAVSNIEQAKSNPNALADNIFRQIAFGAHPLGEDPAGTITSIQSVTLNDLQSYYDKYLKPNITDMHVVGSLGKDDILKSMRSWSENWATSEVRFPEAPSMQIPNESHVYFYDIPGAKQSVLYIGYVAMPETHEDHWPATIMNYKLGGGGFASRFTQQLREEKGYTYGIRSGFTGDEYAGPFLVSTGVRTNVTYESLDLIRTILSEYPGTFSEEDLEDTRSYFIKSNARAFETPGAKLNMLEKISMYGWKPEYVLDQEQKVKDITLEEIRTLARRYVDPDQMIYVIVGDAETQLEALEELGYGSPIPITDPEAVRSGWNKRF